MTLFEVTIPGRPVVKKNTARRFRRCVVYSKRWTEWEMPAFKKVISAKTGPTITRPVRAEFEFHFKNHQWEADTSNLIEGPADVIEKAGIIENDKLIYEIFAKKVFGDDEKVVVRLFELHD